MGAIGPSDGAWEPVLYILGGEGGRTPVAIDDPVAWAEWMGTEVRAVAWTQIEDVVVSTVFIALPTLPTFSPMFETMVFGGPLDTDYERYRRSPVAGDRGHAEAEASAAGQPGESVMGDAAPNPKDPGAHGPRPSIGRIVHVYGEKGGPYAAIITELAPDQTTMIGVTIFLPGGEVRGVANFDARGAGAGSFGSFVQEGGKLYNVWTWVWPPRD